MINNKFQMTNSKFIISLLMLLLLMAFGCQQVDKPVRGEEAVEGKLIIVVDLDPDDAPESHKSGTNDGGDSLKNSSFTSSSLEGLEYWQAYHPVLVSELENPVLKADTDELCLDCHSEPDTACNVCHTYVGVKLVTAAEEE